MLNLMCSAILALAALLARAIPEQPVTRASEPPQFRRGVNVLGYDPYWKNPAKARFQTRHFTEIRRAGFDFVRVNMFIFDRMDANNRIDPAWLKRLDGVTADATKAGLGVILDEHNSGICAKAVTTCRVKLAAAWSQLAERYRNQPSSVAFELLNEPHGGLDAETWNAMIPGLLSIVRATNPDRTVIIGPTKWYNLSELPKLRLPPQDRNILVTFHYYGPYRFTHQGTPWSKIKGLRGVTWGSHANRRMLRSHFDMVGAWARQARRPILLGEFGVYDQSGTPIEMRASYVSALACEAQRHRFGWAYWQFDGNFILWDMKRNAWVKPIKDALMMQRPPGECLA